MSKRQAIEIPGFAHSNPIPSASRVGPLLASSVIVARDPGAETIPESLEAQFENCFHHIGEILEVGGGTWDDVVRITFFVPDAKARAACNPTWVKHFPDADHRPARHTQMVGGTGPITCEFIAYIER